MSILELHRVTVTLPGTGPVLRGLSLAAEEGSIAAVLGPNGSGKTTLLDTCLGWRRPDRGEVLLAGRPLAEWSRRERGRTMSLVPQRESVRFSFSVEEYATLGRAPHLHPLESPGERDRAVVREALAACGIAALHERPVATLSGGEWQLALIARSLAQQPRLLLLDEPATHLDPANQRRVFALLRRLAGLGIAVLFTSHDPQAAAAVADVVHLLKGGRIRHTGPARKVLTPSTLMRVYGVRFRVTRTGRSLQVGWLDHER